MSTFEEYAALARELSARQRAAERKAVAEADRLRELRDTAARLAERLTGQAAWLRRLGGAIGEPPPVSSTPDGRPPAGTRRRELPAGAARLALPLTGGPVTPARSVDPGRVVVPAPAVAASDPVAVDPALPVDPLLPVGQTAVEPVPGWPVDPVEALEQAGHRADEADRHGQRAEALAREPRLLPGWSSLLRAAVVYLGCVVVGLLPMAGLVLAFDAGRIDAFTLGAWLAAGLPATAFLVGFLLLGRYGRPVLGDAPAPRHPRAGFLICFLLVPVAYCGYLAFGSG